MRRQPYSWSTLLTKLGFHKKSRGRTRVGNHSHRKLRYECCEDRRLLAVLTVSEVFDANVDNLGDAPGTLRQAIFDAEFFDGPDIINFALPAGQDTITLGLDENGDPLSFIFGGSLQFSESLTIDAQGQDITIDASGNSSGGNIFDITDIFGPGGGDVEIIGLTLTGANAGVSGGAISALDTNLKLVNTTITGNQGYDGGGLYFKGNGHNLTVISSTISDNSLSYGTRGGGALITGTDCSIVIRGTTFSGNSLDAFKGNGGGVFLDVDGSDSSIEILNSEFSGNSALGTGTNAGGLYLDIADTTNVVLDRLLISNNVTDDDAGGLMIINSGGEVRLRNSTITGNTARDNDNSSAGGAGGIALTTSGGAATFIEDSTIALNIATAIDGVANGGAMNIEAGELTTITIINTTISGNRADKDGGAIDFSTLRDGGSVEILHSTITDNRANWDEDASGTGGAFELGASATDVTLDHTIVAGNFNGTGTTPDDIVGTVTQAWSLVGIAPNLGPLADNGGPTLTHAPLPGSPAIDAGDPNITSAPDFDQRGVHYYRIVDGDDDLESVIDIGALELQLSHPTINNFIINSDAGGNYANIDYEFDEVVGSGDQLLRVPVGAANIISLQFSEQVSITSGHLEFVALNRYLEVLDPGDPDNPAIPNKPLVEAFDPPTPANGFTATWTLDAPLPAAFYLLRIQDTVTDIDGNPLNGDWLNPGSLSTTAATSTFPSGDAVIGAISNLSLRSSLGTCMKTMF